MAHFNFAISQNAKWGKIFFYKKSTATTTSSCDTQPLKPLNAMQHAQGLVTTAKHNWHIFIT